jgi:hypothetical protein
LIELTMLENPVSETTVLPVSKTTVLAVPKTAHEVATAFEVARSPEEARSTPKSKPTQDQRSAENRAHAAAVLPNPALSQDHDHDQKPELDAPIERMLAKLGIKLTPPPEPQPKPKVKSAVLLLRERGWIVTTDGGWPCAEKPGEHNCEGGLIFARDERGHESTLRCKVCLDAERQRQQAQPEEWRESTVGFGFGLLDMFNLTPRLPAFVPPQLPGPRTIEAEWAESKPAAQLPAQRDVGDIMPEAMLRECIKSTEVVTDRTMDSELRKRAIRMLRYGNVARYGADAFGKALLDARRERWLAKHGCCHVDGDDTCDGSCGHDPDECDGHVLNLTDKGVLDLLGCAIYSLTGNEHYGRHDSGAPNAVYERLYAA